jgi:hypothetical protein
VASAWEEVNVPAKIKLCYSAPFAENNINPKPVSKQAKNLGTELNLEIHISISRILYAPAGIWSSPCKK